MITRIALLQVGDAFLKPIQTGVPGLRAHKPYSEPKGGGFFALRTATSVQRNRSVIMCFHDGANARETLCRDDFGLVDRPRYRRRGNKGLLSDVSEKHHEDS